MNLFRWWRNKQTEDGDGSKSDNPNTKELQSLHSSTPSYHIADHLVVSRLGNSHHGIYSGESNVIYYNYYTGLVTEGPLEEYAKGAPIKVVYSPMMYSSSVVISRARSRLGAREHHVVLNISEQFVRWARGGGSW